MPVSHPANISPIVSEVIRLMPRTVIELGVGRGLFGNAIRNYLQGARIFGVEGFKQYRNLMWGAYTRVDIEDFREHVEKYAGFDLVLMIDSLEHVEREQAERMLTALITANKHVIVSVPEGNYPQGAAHGNELERHLSTWYAADFEQFGGVVIHKGVCSVVSIPGHAK